MLGYLVVLLTAGVVGWGVYWLVLNVAIGRAPATPEDVRDWTETAAPSEVGSSTEPTAPVLPSGGVYVPVTQGRPSWQSRLSGVLGLAIAVVVAALSAAFALYSVGQLIARLLRSMSTA